MSTHRRLPVAPRALVVVITICSLVFVLLIPSGCQQLGEGLTKVVMMEFDQSLNFKEYEFENAVMAPGPTSDQEWKKILIHDTSGENTKRGVWILYQICSIRNEAPKAEPFTYDVSKFYVDYGGNKHYYKPLAPYTYENAVFVGLKGTPGATTVIAPKFRQETQAGPDQQFIPANSSNTLSVSWRFVIYVSTPTSDQTDLFKLNLPLRYDGTPVNTINRNNDTVPASGTVVKSGLPTVCRPPKN